MSPKARRDYKAPRDRHEVWVAVAVAVAIVVVTGILVWFVRPNQDSGSSGTTTTSPATTTTAAPTDTTVPATSTP